MSTPDLTTNNAGFDSYLRSMAADDADLLGCLAIYNVTGVEQVTTDELRNWFEELELDMKYLPGPVRPIEAFEKATSSAKTSYPLGGAKRRDHGKTGQTVTLMMRPVVRDETRIVRHLVRELVDHANEELSYEVEVAVAEFERATGPNTDPGDGTMTLTPVNTECLEASEQQTFDDLTQQITDDYENRRHYVSADRLRKLLRDYIETELSAVRIHNGVYFVPRAHLAALGNLRQLAQRFSGDLTRVPLPDSDESRQMVDGAFHTKVAGDLQSLARDLAREQADPKGYRIRQLHKRFTSIKDATTQHQEQMHTHLSEVDDHMQLLEQQMASLFMSLSSDGQE